MQSAPIPENEAARLAALRSYGILDTPDEVYFDDFTWLASMICKTPISLISLLDEDRQWFKSRVGLDAKETPRSLAFCAHTVLETEMLEVPNALEDPRFADNPLVTGTPEIRFYAGVPLTNRDGYRLGTLCVIDREARSLTADQKEALYRLSRQVVQQLELKKQFALQIQVETALKNAQHETALANRAKTAFLANMSHEIRTPMNGIIGLTEVLLGTDLTEHQRECQKMVSQSAESLMMILNDILDFSKIDSGKLTLEKLEFHLRDTLAATLQALTVRSAKKGVELAYLVDSNVPDCLVGDASRLRQILVHLVGNAIKFTSSGEIIVEVATESVSQEQVSLHIKISDTGVGIAPEKLTEIFQSFTQAENYTTRRYGGTGLGLTISQQLIDLMHGRIWVESELGKGSVFHFTVQLDQGDPAHTPALLLPEELLHIPVLLVDDNFTSSAILQALLRSWKIEPLIAKSGSEALQILESKQHTSTPIRLVLLDSSLPDMDNAEVVRQIRLRSASKDEKILLLSSSPHVSDSSGATSFGVDQILTKPPKASDLFNAIAETLQKTRINAPAPPSPPACQQACQPMSLLLVEDGYINQVMAIKLLENRGHSVTLATNGVEALKILGDQSFDAILMDVQMPEMGGEEATAIIRQREVQTGKHVPIIAMTANAITGDREQYLAAGMDDYISKPVHAVQLYAIVEKHASQPLLAKAAAETTEDIPSGRAEPEPFSASEFRESIADLSLMKRLLELFFETSEHNIHQLNAALQKNDMDALHRASHALQGMVGNYSAAPALQAASDLAKIARAGKPDQAAEGIRVVVYEMKRLSAALKEFQNQLPKC